jgi:5-methyltetrahydrofolate--homocysteine methyltransferase
MDPLLQTIYNIILEGDIRGSEQAVTAALDAGIGPQEILNTAMMTAMEEVGRLFTVGEYFIPEMLVAAKTMQRGLGVLRPRLVAEDYQPVAKVIMGTVRGDQHDIGKNLVGMMLEGAAFEVIDLGSDVAPEQFVAKIQETGAELIGMSAMLTTTMVNMKVTIDALQAAGLREQVKVMVGGAPVRQSFADEIGADGYAPDAGSAVGLAKSLLKI